MAERAGKMNAIRKETEGPVIRINGVQRAYEDANGEKLEVLKGLLLDIRKGEFISLIGPSGCGKTTLLRLIAGLDHPQGGELFLNGEKIQGTDYHRGYVFQQSNLFPWETIEGNISAGLRARGVYNKNKGAVTEYIRLTGLDGFEKAYPHQVSGGMAQRASLARALINEPTVLLLDEPLGALDAFTRMDLQDKILDLWQQRRTTMVLVTHDVDEAVYLSDRIVIMSPRPGKIEEVLAVEMGRPRQRNSPDFIQLRNAILEKLHLSGKRRDPEFFL